ncbi:phenoloxidase-activating factor 2-like [Anopheles maculipalpis]|uniref:phenoloxidase-activating factor 2-like n=1 Tax=Anopheles maculipalpis TaxID=1496333 RepID=UPI0021590BD7|nr:phenoloxidase-activating factor 2-like [Anopheles maculipalpis]
MTSQSSYYVTCNGGYCLPKHLCPTGTFEEVSTLDRNERLTLQVDEENECGDFMKICCKGSLSSFDNIPTSMNVATNGDYKCGLSNPEGLLYDVESNLTYAKYGEFPWTVAILKMSFSSNNIVLTYVGGGTLIHPKFVLTAAHTLEKPHRYVARFGEWNINSEAEAYPSQDIGIEEHILHPSFRDLCTPENDIALAVLKRSVIYTEHIRPLCLPTEQDALNALTAKRCIATGWGRDVRTQQPAPIMKRIELNVVANTTCQTLYRLADRNSYFKLHRSFMCAEAAAVQDTCDKDGGTPMACPREDGSYALIGITSWGLECGRTDAPGVYVDVPKFACWINNTIAGYEEFHAEE